MIKKKSAFLKEENLLTLLSQNNFIVPEIQREYVWGENEKVIVKFLTDLKNKIGVCCANCNLPSSENKINIGFLYSYKPDYVIIEHDRFLDENLIDGQQRFTTLFLLLFYCALKELKTDGKNRKEEFLTLIRFEEKLRMCFDFRVRDMTKRFMLELIERVDSVKQLKDIKSQTWFLNDYQNDVSIKSMCKALDFIRSIFSDNTRYFNHLINYVVFWHFKTEATTQGEELYITMNARGEELADNEVTKAALMIGGSEIYEWGKKWEEWQQFFWKYRDKEATNPNADKGFNNFLACIAGLEYYLKKKEGIESEQEIQQLTFEKIEKYYEVFKLLIEKRDQFQMNYNYSDWIQNCLNEIWIIFNKNETNWFADYLDKDKSTERNRMVLLWSWFYYVCELKKFNKEFSTDDLFRFLRFFWIRYKNNNRSVSTLKKTIDYVIINGIWDTIENEIGEEVENPEDETDKKYRTVEEIGKNNYLSLNSLSSNIRRLEELIWQIEDHPLNLDGSDVGNINISHIIDFNQKIDENYLIERRDTFNRLFPNGTKKGSSILKSILLHYGSFFIDTSYYHKRYDFSNWKKNIRKPEFKLFISHLIGKSTKELLQDLKAKYLAKYKDDILKSTISLSDGYSLSEKLIFYSILLNSEDLWSEGEKIIIHNEVDSPRLFKDENKIIYNSKGNFKGQWGNTDLWSKVKGIYNNPLLELKRKIES